MEKKFYGFSLAVLLVAYVLVSIFLILREMVPYMMGSGITAIVISTPFAAIILLIFTGWVSIKWTKLVLKFFKKEDHEQNN